MRFWRVPTPRCRRWLWKLCQTWSAVVDRHAGAVERQELSHAIDRFAQGLPPMTSPADRRQATVSHTAASAASAWHDPGLCGRISAAITTCRARQHELSLVLLEIDDYAQLLVGEGLTRTLQVVAAVPQGISLLCDIPCECLLIGDARYAILLPDCDRRQAVAVARTLVDHLPDWLLDQGILATPIASTAGVATLAVPTRNSRPEDLIDAADRCLFAAKSSRSGAWSRASTCFLRLRSRQAAASEPTWIPIHRAARAGRCMLGSIGVGRPGARATRGRPVQAAREWAVPRHSKACRARLDSAVE